MALLRFRRLGWRRSRSLLLVVSFTLACFATGPHRGQAAPGPQVATIFSGLGLGFERNAGQTDARVLYLARARGYTLFLTRKGLVVSTAEPNRRARAAVVRLDFERANPKARVAARDLLPGRASYFIGKDPRAWRTGVPTYGRVKYADLYRGIDLVFHGNGRGLECDFMVAPGAHPDAIRLSLRGGHARLAKSGDLVIRAGHAELTLRKPGIFQASARGGETPVDGSYRLSHSTGGLATLAIALGAYDHTKPLVIDPQLVYSTYLGGSFSSQGNAIAVGSGGLIYVTGMTTSADFPLTSDAFENASGQTSGNSKQTTALVFVTILNPSASASAQLVYSTFLGGKLGGQQGNAIVADKRGFVYVTGSTGARDFPVTQSGFQTSITGNGEKAFLSVLDPAASGSAQLVYSTFIGGSGQNPGESGNGIAIDSSGLAYIAGSTNSTDLPVTSNAAQAARKAQNGVTGFVSVFDPTKSGGASLVYSTYLGGSVTDTPSGIALGPNNAVYVAGTTLSPDFPVTRTAFQSRLASQGGTNAFLTVLDLSQSGSAGLAYSTYLGGAIQDSGSAVAADSGGFAYVAGSATSTNFPVTTNALQKKSKTKGLQTAFVSKLDPSESGAKSLVFSTLLGGSITDAANAVAVDSSGRIYLAGTTSSADFPVTKGAFETVLAPSSFLSVIDPGLKGKPALVYSTFFGGLAYPGSSTAVSALALDSEGVAYLTGDTNSPALPVAAGALQSSLTGAIANEDAFVAALDPSQALSSVSAQLTAKPSPLGFPDQFFGGIGVTSASQTVALSYAGSGTGLIEIQGIATADNDPATPSEFAVAVSGTTCTLGLSLNPGDRCSVATTFTPGKAGSRSAVLSVVDNGRNAPLKITLTGKGVMGPLQVTPTELDFGAVPVGTLSASQAITFANNNPGPVLVTKGEASGDAGNFTGGKGGAFFLNGCPPPRGRGVTTNGPLGEIAANATCQGPIQFRPTAARKFALTLKIFADASNSPFTVKLVGTGVAPSPSPSPTPISRPTPPAM